jgi:hypothetical protein
MTNPLSDIKEALAIDAEARRIGAVAEGARIRRELLQEFSALWAASPPPRNIVDAAHLHALGAALKQAIDRIIPEES